MYRIGVDLGGTKTAAALIDAENRIICKKTCKTEPEKGNDFISEAIAGLISAILEERALKTDDIELLGIASPGAIDVEHGIVERACNLLMEHYPLADKLSELTKIKNIKVENDANAAALGEAVAGAAKGSACSVMITLGTGVGGGFIIDGKVFSGFNYTGGEFGHMVIEYNGRQCNCGRKGCWEAYSSATALISDTKKAMEKDPSSLLHEVAKEEGVNGKTAFIAARMGDKAAKKVVDDYIGHLACGVVNIINMLQPSILCIGGGISNEGDGLIIPLITKVKEEIFTQSSGPSTELRIAMLGNNAGLIGAANL
ncbi:MAG: ROK family protein [Clostridia bacterium]|nr:ROK family protein [Clostridia bacterium]MBQ3869149.1 ROK family protein [Clostridia bacterium]